MTNSNLSGRMANLGCGSGKRNRWQCRCNKVYKCVPHSIQALILFKGMRLDMIVNWPTPDQLNTWEDYKMAYYKKFGPRGELMDLEVPHERVGQSP